MILPENIDVCCPVCDFCWVTSNDTKEFKCPICGATIMVECSEPIN